MEKRSYKFILRNYLSNSISFLSILIIKESTYNIFQNEKMNFVKLKL